MINSLSDLIEDLKRISTFHKIKDKFILDLILPETKELDLSDRWSQWDLKKRDYRISSIIDSESKLSEDILFDTGKAQIIDLSRDKFEVDVFINSFIIRKTYSISKATVFVSPGVYVREVDITYFDGIPRLNKKSLLT
jgi:hypothetical protein